MEYVAQKLGFLKASDQPHGLPITDTRNRPEEVVTKKRKISESADSSSSDSDLSLGKLKLDDSSSVNNSQNQKVSVPPSRSFISIPTPIRPPITSVSVLNQKEQFSYLNALNGLVEPFSLSSLFANNYLTGLYAPYGVTAKLIGPLTVEERREKVQRYLQKKKNRQWKNVKYTVRQELAENRKRVQGRFIKTEKKWKWNEVVTQANTSGASKSE